MDTLQQLFSEIHGEREPAISREGQVARLREAGDRYISDDVPFKVGDLVTPRADGSTKDPGMPCLVIASAPHSGFHFGTGEPGASTYGMKMNLRVLRLSGHGLIAAWDEAANYEPYTEPTE